MTPRDSIAIATAALKWAAAHERRRAATAEKRRADAAHRDLSVWSPDYWPTARRQSAADEAVSIARRRERKAVSALVKVCEEVRGSLLDADIADPASSTSRAPVLELSASFQQEA
ncbi:hypothetical protein J2W32_001473 [Variovorax boronicumulans]|uniref:Uncharacterized protein n=1 Tax=Variovorax boronicumulans TaxID=436515 RepID=A0AAW8CWA4_9BURK|nr:hypothetical protein [Variovorax boronicumulans]MDP9893222.1 hypothetical protein [Variovorax boronicumulans]MDQ0052431.1 hypothetical protein [Variovorax boronicumulans]